MSFLENEVIDTLYRCASTLLEALNASPLFYVESEENARCLAPPLFLEAKMADPISAIEVARLEYHSAQATTPYTLEAILKEIKTGQTAVITSAVSELAGGRTLRHACEFARDELLAKNRVDGYNEIKKCLPAFLPAGYSSARTRQIDILTGVVCVEWDNVEDVVSALQILSESPYTLAVWVSLSGTGVKALFRVSPTPTPKNFKEAWYSAAVLFEEIGEPDLNSSNAFQPQAISYHPYVHVNPASRVISWDPEDAEFASAYPETSREASLFEMDSLPIAYQALLSDAEFDENGKCSVRVPCPSGSHEHDSFENLRSNATSVFRRENGDLVFVCFKCDERDRTRVFRAHQDLRPPPSEAEEQASVERLIENAPPLSVHEGPSFRYFSVEERVVARQILGISPDAGWQGDMPVWTPKYQYLHPLTNKFAMNGQPSEVEKRRVWSTLFGSCEACGGITAKWIDRYLLTAGYYCDGCHKDYPLGSYLEIELNRKLLNSIDSEYQGYLGENPDFEDFCLFRPGMITHLGAGMGTGKTTEIVRYLNALSEDGIGKGIIAVPRISLAVELAYALRRQAGDGAWGLWTEGAGKENKFLGTSGAVVCVPSLPQVIEEAEDQGLGIQNLYIAIDEIDFSYGLLSSVVLQRSPSVKKILRDAIQNVGLIVAGQTESTLALEAFANEMEAEVQGFYATAPPADGHVLLKHHPAGTNMNAVLASAIDDIKFQLRAGKNVYVFCGSRRDGDILAEIFRREDPVIYNAYTRGDSRCKELLYHQSLTDSRLFIGTSAAGVGISFLDSKGVTVVINCLAYGSRNPAMAGQKCIRNRGRQLVILHYTDYKFALPLRPTKTRDVSLYHEQLKSSEPLGVQRHGVTKLAAAQALESLADVQFGAFLEYHLGAVGNMEVRRVVPKGVAEEAWKAVRECRGEILRRERKIKKEKAKDILVSVVSKSDEPQLLTSSEIRKLRNQGILSPEETLGHELANEAARAVGWDDEVDRRKDGDLFKDILSLQDINVALELVGIGFDFENLSKKRWGYFAVHRAGWMRDRFDADMALADTTSVVAGHGVERVVVKDPRFLGELLAALLKALVGVPFEQDTLIRRVGEVLEMKTKGGKTFRQVLCAGGLGASEYRKARFLHCAEDRKLVINWLEQFISEHYPAILSRKDGIFAMQPDRCADVYLKSFQQWLSRQPDFLEGSDIQLEIFDRVSLPDPDAERIEIARERRANGETLTSIATDLDVKYWKVQRWCRGITPKKRRKPTRTERRRSRARSSKSKKVREIVRLYGMGVPKAEIHRQTGTARPTIDAYLASYDF